MKTFLFSLTILISLLACKSKQDAVNSLEDMKESENTEATASALFKDMHNSQNSLDVHGTYMGILPCDDCIGIQFKLTIQDDSTYSTKSIHPKNADEVFEQKGRYDWNIFGSKIICRIDNKAVATYKVEENQLVLLEQEAHLKEKTDALYILYKNSNPIWNKLWFATTFKNEKVEKAEFEPHLTFLPKGQLKGSGGCNTLDAKYTLIEDQKIKVGAVSSTKKACGDLKHYDRELSEALNQSTSYKVQDKSKLWLYNANGETLAVFEAEIID